MGQSLMAQESAQEVTYVEDPSQGYLLNKFDNATFTTIKGNCCNSRFRGQVRHGYSKLRYEISVREVVEDEDSICVYLDAAIFNDDVQIMQIDSYSMRITNADK